MNNKKKERFFWEVKEYKDSYLGVPCNALILNEKDLKPLFGITERYFDIIDAREYIWFPIEKHSLHDCHNWNQGVHVFILRKEPFFLEEGC